jgi:hypothetical protein
LDTLQPTFAAPTARPSARRRLLDHGIGAVLALGYWAVVAAMLVVDAVFLVILMGPAIILFWAVLCVCAYGFGLLLCAVAGLLTIDRATRRAAVGFLIGSAAANIGLVVLVVLLAAAIKAALLFME